MKSSISSRKLRHLIGFSLAAVSPILSAADPLPDEQQKLEIMEVTGQKSNAYLAEQSRSSTKLDLSLQETPQSVTVLTRAQLDDFALHSIKDALEATPGVFVQNVETDRTYYTARGFDITNFQIDGLGMPLINGNTHGDLDTALYERIEVVRGANGLMTGVGNPSATINLVRKRPTEALQGSISGSYGSWDRGRLDADFSGSLSNNLRGRLVVAKTEGESYLDRYEQEKNIAYGVIEADLPTGAVLTLGLSHLENNSDGNLWGALPLFYTDGSPTNYDRSTSTSADWSYWNVEEKRGFIEVVQPLSDSWSMTLVYNQNKTDEDSELFYVYGTPEPETEAGLLGYASEYDLDSEDKTFDLYADGRFNLAGREHQLVLGASWAELSYTDVSLYDYSSGHGFPVIPNLKAWDGDTPRPVFAEGETGSDVSDEQRSVYATARFNLLDGLYLITGGRWNDWESEGISYDFPQNTEESKFIPYLGVTYDINDQVTVYSSYTENFVAQTELDADGQRLDPREGESLEVGVKASLISDRLLLSGAIFKVEQHNMPACAAANCFEPDSPYAPSSAESQGIELSLTGELADGWHASLGYTWKDLEADESQADSHIEEFTPEQLLRASTSYRFNSLPALSIGAQLDWQDEIFRTQDAVVAEGYPNAGEPIVTRQKAYALLDLMASYEFSDNLSLSLNIKNATDEKYLNSLYWAQGYYGAERSYLATLSWKL